MEDLSRHIMCLLCGLLSVVAVCAMDCADAVSVTSDTSMEVHADITYLRTTVDLLPLSLVYYPDAAFGPLPTATLDLACTAGNYGTTELQTAVAEWAAAGCSLPMSLTRTARFADCRMQYVFTIPDELLIRLQQLDPTTEVYVALQAWEDATIEAIPTTAIPISNLTLTPDTITLSLHHSTDTIRAIITPADADNQTLTWSIIRGADLITWDDAAHTATMKTNTIGGTVEIVAQTQDGTNLSDTAVVIVPNTSLVSNITITAFDTVGVAHSPVVLSSAVRSLTFTAVVQPSYAADTTLTWAVLGDLTGLAVWDVTSRTLTVLQNGNGGEVRVVASANDDSHLSDTLIVTVLPTPVLATGIVISPESVTLTSANPSATFMATITPNNAKVQSATWSVIRGADLITWDDATHTATMKTNTIGGTVEIVAQTQDGTNLSDTAVVTVPNTSLVSNITITAFDTAGVAHSPAVLSSAVRSLTFTAVVQPSYAADTTLTWAVLGDLTGLAVWDATSRTLTVLQNGNGGEVRVVASANDDSHLSDTLIVTVLSTPVLATGIVISPESVTLTSANPSATFTATITPNNAKVQSATWSVIRGADLITWDDATHTATMKTNTIGGTVEIVAQTQDGTNLSDTAVVTVPNTSLVSNITITASDTAGITHSPAVLSSAVRYLTFTAVVQPSYAADTTLTWAVLGDLTGLAVWDATSRTLTVLQNGNGGEVRVVASANDDSHLSDTLIVTVLSTPVLATGIVVSPESVTLTSANPSATFTATITPNNAKVQSATWSVIRGADLITWDDATHTATMKTNTIGGTVEIVAQTQDGTNLSDTAVVIVPIDTAGMRMWIEVEEGEVMNDCYTLRSPDSIHVRTLFEPTFIHPRVLSYSIVHGKHLVMLDRDISGGLMVSTMPKNVGGEALLQGMAEVEGKMLTAYLTLRIEPETTGVNDIFGAEAVPQRRLVMYNGVIYIECHTADGVEWYNLQGKRVR